MSRLPRFLDALGRRFSQRIIVFVLGVVLVGGAIVFSATSSPAAPAETAGSRRQEDRRDHERPVTWQPASISAEVARGYGMTLRATFTSSTALRNIEFRISPELQPLLHVSPSSLARVRKGQSVDLTLTLSASTSTATRLFQGAIQVREGRERDEDRSRARRDGDRGDEGRDSESEKVLAKPLPVSVLVTVVPLPPDPGDAGKQTLAGIDSDGDGVRDDVQRYIVLTVPDSARARGALTQSAVAMQSSIGDSLSKEASLQRVAQEVSAADCLVFILGTNKASTMLGRLEAAVLNTPERVRAYFQAARYASGQVFRGVAAEDAGRTCAFDFQGMSD